MEVLLQRLERGQEFRTTLTDRIGKLLATDSQASYVQWRDYLGPHKVHKNLIVDVDEGNPGGW